VPFQLSPSFRPMLQRGIELPALDVTYFTSLSFYILLLFGVRGVFMLVFRCACCSASVAALMHMLLFPRVAGPCSASHVALEPLR